MGTEIKCLFKILRQLDVLNKRNFEKSGFFKSGSPDQFPAAVTITPESTMLMKNFKLHRDYSPLVLCYSSN